MDIDRAGTFRGEIVEYGLKQHDSGAVSLSIRARIDEAFEESDWTDWRTYDVQAFGHLNIITKAGKINEAQAKGLIENAGWNGDITSIADGRWKPTPCQFSVKENDYQGNVSYRIDWINAYDRAPGFGNIDSEKAKALQAQYGSQFRALGANANRATEPKPGGKPKAPTPRPKAEPPKASEPTDLPDEIPF